MSLRWVETAGVGFAAALPDGRTAYAEPVGGRWRLRVVAKPGHRGLADLYVSRPTAEACQREAERRYGRRVA